MAVTRDASSPAVVLSDAGGNSSLVTASFTPPSGSVIVAKVVGADALGTQAMTSITISGSAVTFTSRVNNIVLNHTPVAIATAPGGGVATTVTAAFTSAGLGVQRILIVSVWAGAQLAGTPATNVLDQGTNVAPSSTLTTVAANSVVDAVVGDWAAIDGTSRTYRSSATEQTYHTLTGAYTVYAFHQAAATAGSQTYGLTAPTGQTPTLAAIEIQASGGAAVKPNRRAVLQAVHRAANF
jgi:hypothetical protein